MEHKDIVIIGGGISGLSALHFIRQKHPEYDITLYEKDSRLGGTIGTDHLDGYSLDWGPNGFLDREPLTLRLCEEMNLNDALEKADEQVNNRYILRKGRLRQVPMSPPKFLKSDILSLKGKMRVLCEPLIPGSKTDADESIYNFAKRRIGTEAADYLVQPMVSGIYGGVAERLSLKSCFPIMRAMESEHGSLFRAMIARARKAKAEGKKSGGPAGPGGWLTSFNGGLYKIIDEFESTYDRYIIKSCGVGSITRENEKYLLELDNGQRVSSTRVILALPVYQAAKIVASLSKKLSEAFSAIPYAPIAVICLGYDRSRVSHDLNGFGFLVPRKEKRNILGTIWTSSIFKDRAPAGKVQFRTMVGGDGNHESMKLSDRELIEQVRNDLDGLLGVKGEPELIRLYRWEKGIPQFIIGHSETMTDIEIELDRLGHLYITGNAYYGIGLNDCIKQSYKISQLV